MHTRQFSALPEELAQLINWLCGFSVTTAAMEATGIYWLNVHVTLEQASIKPVVFNAQHVKQIKGRKTDVADSIWLARIGLFGLGRSSFAPAPEFRELRDVSHKRRQLVRDRARGSQQAKVQVVEARDRASLHRFITAHVEPGTRSHTDDFRANPHFSPIVMKNVKNKL